MSIPIVDQQDQFPEVKLTTLNQKPDVVHIKNLLTPEECQHIIEIASKSLSPSTMIVNNQEVVNPGRSSRSAYLTKNGQLANDNVIDKLLFKCSELSGYSKDHFEGLKVVNYQKGQKYGCHHDYFRNHTNFTRVNGDRILTFFIYLNTLNPEDGGCTNMPKLGIKSKPVAGEALFWTNMDFEGNYFEETLHEGQEILTDVEKWGINLWIREKSYFPKK